MNFWESFEFFVPLFLSGTSSLPSNGYFCRLICRVALRTMKWVIPTNPDRLQQAMIKAT